MKLQFYSIEKLKKEIIEIIGKYLDLNSCRIFFFGSRVSGKGDERSDIDIGIDGTKEVPYEIMANIKEDIENLSLLYKIEIVDFKKTSDDFQKVALQFIEPIALWQNLKQLLNNLKAP